jgi:hypothetical protein
MDQGLLQIAVLGEADPLIPPQTVGVEFGDLWQRVIATITVIAGVGSPGL